MNLQPHSSRPLTQFLGLDLRSLGLFRIGVALVVLYDLADRSRDLVAHYTGSGVLPLFPLRSLFAEPYFWSLNYLSDAPWFQGTIFCLTALAALALLLGYRTRLANFLCWALVCSIQMRNPLILQFGDVVLRLWLFWGLFLPLGACFSTDQLRFKPSEAFSWRGGASVAFIFQLAFIYWFTAALKTGPDWWADGTAVYYALNYETLAKPLGLFLAGFPGWLKAFTYLTLVVEILGPLFIFIPWKNGPLRTLAVVMMVGFHLGLALTLHLGIFPVICVIGWIAVLPAWFWQRLALISKTSALKIEGPNTSEQIKLPRWQPRTWAGVVALILIAYIFVWNLRTVRFDWVASWFPYRANRLGEVLRLEQRWGMYAPQPSKTGGWYVIPAILSDGTEMDLFRKQPLVRWKKPERVAMTFRNDRWGNYLTRLWDDDFSEYRTHYLQYLLADYAKQFPAGPPIQSVQLVQMRQVTEPYPQKSSIKKIVLFEMNFTGNRD